MNGQNEGQMTIHEDGGDSIVCERGRNARKFPAGERLMCLGRAQLIPKRSKGDCAKPLLEIRIKAIVSREGCNVKQIEYNKIRHL